MQKIVIPIAIAAFMPYVLTMIAKLGAFSKRDNHNTRDWQAKLDGYRKRAHWAHLNGFEVFPAYAVAAVLAAALTPLHSLLNLFLWGFIGARVVYAFCYIKDLAVPRSLAWFAGAACTLGLFIIAAAA